MGWVNIDLRLIALTQIPYLRYLASYADPIQNSATTGTAPSWLFLHRSLRTRLDLLQLDVRAHVRKNQEQQKEYYDRCSHRRNFTIGQNVWVHNFGQGLRWLEGVIIDSLGPSSFLIRTRSGEMWRWHVDHLRGGRIQPHNERGEERESEGEVEIAYPGDDVDPPISGTNRPAYSFATSSGSSEPIPQPYLFPQSSVQINRRYPSHMRKPPGRV